MEVVPCIRGVAARASLAPVERVMTAPSGRLAETCCGQFRIYMRVDILSGET